VADGVLLLNKPVGISSHDAVNRVRSAFGQRTVGHAGTLDPLAEGLLMVCLGRATKIVQWLTGMDKTYEATVQLGMESATMDAEGIDPEMRPRDTSDILLDRVSIVLGELEGDIDQKVPEFSAVKVEGRPLYKQARKGQPVETPVRTVRIHEIRLVEFNNPELHIKVRCGKGTYIRALASAIGQRLGCGAYLKGLVRTAIGDYSLDKAISVYELPTAGEASAPVEALLPIEDVLPLAAIRISDDFAHRVVQGPPLTADHILGCDGHFAAGETVALRDRSGRIRAVGIARSDSDCIKQAERQDIFSYSRVLN
jgi:tRNA pseudouridine55 synthase